MLTWPADHVERWAVERLTPYARNARTHSDAQVAQIAASITEWGWTVPVLVDEAGGLIAGHGRVLAAQRLGLAEVPVMVARGWTEPQKRAYVLADNKLALNAGWDAEMLRVELSDLQGMGADLSLIGFSDTELAGILDTTEGLTDPDDVPAVPADPVTVLGDVWLLGRHRLVCGDSTTVESVDAALGGVKADCVFTSPPYGVGVDYGKTYQDTVENLREMLPKLARSWLDVVRKGGFAVVNFGDIVSGRDAAKSSEPCEYPMAIEYWPAFRGVGWCLWSRRVWCKPNARVHSPWAIRSNRAASDWENVWTWKAPGKAIIQRVNGEHQSANGWF